jgi:hypothetical protein
MEKAKGGDAGKNQHKTWEPRSGSATGPRTLADIGVSKQQAADRQKLAVIPEEQFEAARAGAKKPMTLAVFEFGVTDHVGGALLAFRSGGHRSNVLFGREILKLRHIENRSGTIFI